MNSQRIALVIASSVGVLGFFLPWTSIPLIGSANGTDGTRSWIVLIAFVLCLVLSLIGNIRSELHKGILGAQVLLGLIAAVLGIFQIADTSSVSNQFVHVDIGIGLYLVVISGIVIALLAVLRSLFRQQER